MVLPASVTVQSRAGTGKTSDLGDLEGSVCAGTRDPTADWWRKTTRGSERSKEKKGIVVQKNKGRPAATQRSY